MLEILPRTTNKTEISPFQVDISRKNEEEEIMKRMLAALKQPEKLLREEVQSLRQEKKQLLAANEHYFKMLVP